jgi:hypothetical protein
MESCIDTHERYKVDIPVDAEIMDKIRDFRPLQDPDKCVYQLLPVVELSEVFSEAPLRKCLHIIVQPPPSGEFLCLSGLRSILTPFPFATYLFDNLR